MASNYWGIPRTTHDLDFVVQLPMSAVPRIVQEFSGDFYIEEAAVRAAYQPPLSIQRHRYPLRVEGGFLAAQTRTVRPGNASTPRAGHTLR